MTKPRVVPTTVALALSAAMACNRAQADRDADHAAAQVKVAAAQAGEKLADSWLTTKIQAQFFADDDIKARYINVSTRDGAVTLKGFVENDDVRRQVLEITRNTDGVKQVDDRQLLIGRPSNQSFESASAPVEQSPVATSGVTTTPPAGAPLDDATVTSLVQAKFFLDPSIKSRRIDVQTAQGVVTLHGEVASENERAQALSLARGTPGVSRVEDSLTVDVAVDQPSSQSASPAPVPSGAVPPADAAPSADAAPGGSSIESALRSNLAADTAVKMAKIDVSVRSGVATLQGTAPNQAAKQRALTIAKQTEGVTQVVDRITVASRR
jgi:hyperosmotically inducible periplasmic protein